MYGTNRADRSLTGENGVYEGFISREPCEFQVYARGYPSSDGYWDSHTLKIKGDETEIQVDFHLGKNLPMRFGPIPRINSF